MQLYRYTCIKNHNDDTIMKTSDTVLRKIYLSLYWKGCVWEGVGDRTELQHIDLHSCGHQHFFPILLGCSTGGLRPSLSGYWFSLPHLISNTSDPHLLSRGPKAYSLLSLLHLVSNWSGLQTNWLPVFTELYNNSTPPSSCGHHNCTHSTHPGSRL